MAKRLTPFGREFWIKKGLTIEEADYKRNSFRPIRKEYWLKKGYKEEDAISKAKESKKSNNKKGAAASANRTKEEIYKTSARRPEYWMEAGLTNEEAIKKVAEVQSTFSLEKCKKKHGNKTGHKIWKDRQVRWQKKMNSKSSSEKERIDKLKNTIRLDLFKSTEDAIEILNTNRNMNLTSDYGVFSQKIMEEINNNPDLKYNTPQKVLNRIPKIQRDIFNLDLEKFNKDFSCLFDESKGRYKSNARGYYRKWINESLLRSSFEIYFYDNFIKLKLDDYFKMHIDKKYPNSKLRFDFCLNNQDKILYIEICPTFDSDEEYRIKMKKKEELFGCILLKNVKEIDNFLKGLKK